MDCGVAAAFDHVSHHVTVEAMEAMKVPPVLIAAWIKKYRGSETLVTLDDILTKDSGDLFAADLFGAVLDVPATASVRCTNQKNGSYL